KTFSQLYQTITLKTKDISEMSDSDRAIFLHQQSFGFAKPFFCSASDTALYRFMKRHQDFIEELRQRNYDLLLKFQFPQTFHLLQPEDVAQIDSFGSYIQALEAVIESGARMEQRCEPGKGMEISKKFRD